jgi:hypothetical protein
MGAEVFHVDGETVRHNQVNSRNFANASKNHKLMLYTEKNRR